MMRNNLRRELKARLSIEPILAVVTLLVAWLVIAEFTPPFIVPPISDVFADLVEIFLSFELLSHALLTLGRVGLGLVTAFTLGSALGLWMGYSKFALRFSMVLVQLTQGVPALSWVVIAIIWFRSIELRVWFIVFIVTLPGFVFQALDSYNSIPKELRDMARSLRPRRFDMFRTVTWPGIIPDLLTAWKVNIGLGTRVVLVAELVGADRGVGFQLLSAQQFFNMSRVIAWTAVLVLFVLAVQYLITWSERRLLRYRPKDEEAEPAEETVAATTMGTER